jgi:MerR family copper efflux transcriptional regulator
VRFIKRAQALGFSLDEVSELLELSDARHRRPNRVRAMARARLDGIEAKLDELAHMRDALSELVDACETRCNDDHCPILDAIAAEPADKDD